jgi:hypothetical protein
VTATDADSFPVLDFTLIVLNVEGRMLRGRDHTGIGSSVDLQQVSAYKIADEKQMARKSQSNSVFVARGGVAQVARATVS